jgi:hypothetical protein
MFVWRAPLALLAGCCRIPDILTSEGHMRKKKDPIKEGFKRYVLDALEEAFPGRCWDMSNGDELWPGLPGRKMISSYRGMKETDDYDVICAYYRFTRKQHHIVLTTGLLADDMDVSNDPVMKGVGCHFDNHDYLIAELRLTLGELRTKEPPWWIGRD